MPWKYGVQVYLAISSLEDAHILQQELDRLHQRELQWDMRVQLSASETEQAEEFNGQFTDVFNNSDHSEVPFLSRSATFMADIVV